MAGPMPIMTIVDALAAPSAMQVVRRAGTPICLHVLEGLEGWHPDCILSLEVRR